MKNVLILTLSTGGGHNAVARALETAIIEQDPGVAVAVRDAYAVISPHLSSAVDKGFRGILAVSSETFGAFYRLSEVTPPKADMTYLINKALSYGIADLIARLAPDVVICTHIFTMQMTTALRIQGKLTARCVGVLTDYTVHPLVGETWMDAMVLPSELLCVQARKLGIPPERQWPFGIPVHQKFLSACPREDARGMLGLNGKGPVLLVMGGSMGHGMSDTVSELDRLPQDAQILVVCGNNHRRKRKMDKQKFMHDVRVFGYINNVELFMDAADLILTKPGGITVTEAIAKGLPMVLIDPVHGQESRNIEFLLNYGMAMAVSATLPVDEAVQNALNPDRAALTRQAMAAFGKRDAAVRVAREVLRMLI